MSGTMAGRIAHVGSRAGNTLPTLRILCAHPDGDAPSVFDLAAVFDGASVVSVVSTGAEAIVRSSSEKYDLILLDERLEDMGCYEVCRWLKADSNSKGIPVVILHDPGQPGVDPPADVVVLAFLEQPLDPSGMVMRLRAVLAVAPLEH